MDDTQLAQVRQFNRTLTRRIGVLSDDYLGSGRSLAEARLLFEIGHDGSTVRELRTRLALDSGYVSRLLRTLESQGLATTKPAAHDARVRQIKLTAKGKRAWATLEQRSKNLAASLLQPLGTHQRERLLAAMAEVERLLRASAVVIEPADPSGAEAQACIAAYFHELQHRFDEGFDPTRTISATPEELAPPQGCFLIARLDGEAIGCGGLKLKGKGHGELKRMWVSPSARGLGIAQRLLDALEQHAADSGITVLRLDTHRNLVEARSLYARNGYAEIAAYNGNPYAHHWFEKRSRRRKRV